MSSRLSRIRPGFVLGALPALVILIAVACRPPVAPEPAAGTARFAPQPASWKETVVDVFPGMDGVTLDPANPDEKLALRGRIVWNLWVGDSGLMWDWLAQHGFGTADLLKTIDSRLRPERFQTIGIINQPGFRRAMRPDQYGLFIDVPDPDDPAGRIDQQVDYATYGRSSGVIGLRISDNPRFDATATAQLLERAGASAVGQVTS